MKSPDKGKQHGWCKLICAFVTHVDDIYQIIRLMRHQALENELLINVAWRSNANTWLTTGLSPVFVVANRHHQWLMWGSPRATQLLVKYCHVFPGRFLWNPEPAWPTWFHVEDDLREKWKPFPRARTATAAAAAAAGGNDGRMKHFVALGILTKLTFPFLFSVIKVYWILIAESPMIRMGGQNILRLFCLVKSYLLISKCKTLPSELPARVEQ